MSTETNPTPPPVSDPAVASSALLDDDDCDVGCDMCGGDGIIMLSDAGPGVWGEDTFCDVDRPITCPQCKGKG